MQVSAFARGYLGMIDAQELGRGLSQAADVLQPVVDISPFLGLGLRKQVEILGSTFATDTYGPLATVPNGKVWKVVAYGLYLTNAAGVTNVGVSLMVAMNLLGGAQPYAAISDTIAMGAGISGMLCARNLPMWLKGGDTLGAYGRWAGGNTVFQGAVLLEEYPG